MRKSKPNRWLWLVCLLVLALLAGAVFGLYRYRGSVKKSSSLASEPKEYRAVRTTEGTDGVLGVRVTCTLTEVLNKFNQTVAWDASVTGENIDAAKGSARVKIQVPWRAPIEGLNRANSNYRFNSPTPPPLSASAETMPMPGYAGSLAQCSVDIPVTASYNSQSVLTTTSPVGAGAGSKALPSLSPTFSQPESGFASGGQLTSDQGTANGSTVVAPPSFWSKIPFGPITLFAIVCIIAILAAIRVRTEHIVTLHTPAGRVILGLDKS